MYSEHELFKFRTDKKTLEIGGQWGSGHTSKLSENKTQLIVT